MECHRFSFLFRQLICRLHRKLSTDWSPDSFRGSYADILRSYYSSSVRNKTQVLLNIYKFFDVFNIVDFFHLSHKLLVLARFEHWNSGPWGKLTFNIWLRKSRVNQIYCPEIIRCPDQSPYPLIYRPYCFCQVPLAPCYCFLSFLVQSIQIVHLSHNFHIFGTWVRYSHNYNCPTFLLWKIQAFWDSASD